MPRPLTKVASSGELYARSPAIEAAIDGALTQDRETLVARSTIRDRDAAGFLRNEVLVHLVRETLRCGDDRTMDRLVTVLLDRVRAILDSKVPESVPCAADIRAEILGRFSELIAEDAAGDQCSLDIYEFRFELALRTLRCDVARQFRKRAREVSLDTDDRDDEDDDENVTSFEPQADRDLEPAAVAISKEMLAAVEALPDKERKAFVFHHIYGFKIESDDDTQTTVATLCEVTGRTVRNLLKRARAKLAAKCETP